MITGIKKILEKPSKYAYVLGGIFNSIYQNQNEIFFIASSRIQKTNKDVDWINVYSLLQEKLKKYFPEIDWILIKKNSRFEGLKWSSNKVGVIAKFSNDIGHSLEKIHELIFEKILSCIESRADFLRGLIETSGSVDAFAKYVTRDIHVRLGGSMAIRINVIASKVLADQFINFNPRLNQPKSASKMKNPQFRIKINAYLQILGCWSPVAFNLLKKNSKKLSLLEKGVWNKENVLFTVNSNLENKNLLTDELNRNLHKTTQDIDNRFYKNTLVNSGVDENIAKKESQKLFDEKEQIASEEILTKSISAEIKNEILEKFNFKDALTGEPLYETDQGVIIYHVHHVIPFRMRKSLFMTKESQNEINEAWNLIPLSPNTHARVHKNPFEPKLIIQMYEIISSWLKEHSLSLSDFESMYR